MFEQEPEELLRMLNGTVEAMASLCERIDPYTAGHQRRVARLACAIAKKMGLSDEQVYGIRVIGVVHDIGKMALPDEILSKPGVLNAEEFNIVKLHPQVAYDVLKNLEFPWPVAQTVLQHHERLDGSGYPNGISGEDIILEARILCVADVVESMVSHRPYRPAPGLEKAMEEIELNSGVLYDPMVADACSKLSSNGGIKLDWDWPELYLTTENGAIKNYNSAIVLCGDARDYAIREILEAILKDEDKHIDGIEEVQDQISQMGVQVFLSTQNK